MKTGEKKVRSIAALTGTLALAVLFSACGETSAVRNETRETEKKSEEAEAPLEISIMTITPSTPPAADDNIIKRAIEKATHSKMTIQWVSNNVYADKLNITLASGDIPDLIMINNPFASTFRSMVSQGAFWNITPYVKDYPNLLNGISKTAWELTKMADGNHYGIPRQRPTEGDSFFIIRKDWLDKVGRKPPTTTDELYTVMKSFVEQDPDGNGKNDTTALAAYVSASDTSSTGSLGPVLGAVESCFTGVNGNWKWDQANNRLVYTALLPETRQSLAYLTNAYKEKMMPEDLFSLKLTQARDLFKGNKAGIIVDKTGTMKSIYADELKKVVPSFKYTDFYPLTNINGYNPKGSGFNGILAIPKSVPEAKLKRILKLIDTWMKPEVSGIQLYGLEGVHHVVKDGKKVVDAEKLKKDNASDFNQIVNASDDALLSKAASQEEIEAIAFAKQVEKERIPTSVVDIGLGLYSPTAEQILPELEKNIQDIKTKIILGRLPLAAWDDFVGKLARDSEFQQMSKEMTEAYRKRTGN